MSVDFDPSELGDEAGCAPDPALAGITGDDGLVWSPPVVDRCIEALMLQSPMLEDFLLDEAQLLEEHMPRVSGAAGQVFIAEGTIGHYMLLILRGSMQVTKKSPHDGKVARVAVVKAGAVVGEMSMLDGEPRFATCTALEPTTCGMVSRELMAKLIREQPALSAKLMVKLTHLLAQRLRNTSRKLVAAVGKESFDD